MKDPKYLTLVFQVNDWSKVKKVKFKELIEGATCLGTSGDDAFKYIDALEQCVSMEVKADIRAQLEASLNIFKRIDGSKYSKSEML